MRNFLKTACVLLVMSATGFAQFAQENDVRTMNLNVNLDDPQQVQLEIERYTKMARVGNGLIIVGSAIFGVGLLSVFTFSDPYVGEVVGTSLCITGGSVFFAGIPLRRVGRTRSSALKYALPNTAYVAPNSVNFTWNF